MANALKSEALPMVDLLSQALDREIGLTCLEDNMQCIAAVRNKYLPSLQTSGVQSVLRSARPTSSSLAANPTSF
eukprot:441878-Heterocapsa_arctica.AAC.1